MRWLLPRLRAVVFAIDLERTCLERFADDVVPADALHPELRPQHQPMSEPGHGDRLDVVGRRKVAPLQGGAAAAQLEQRQGAARAGADLQPRVRARRRDELDDVAAEALGDVDVLDREPERARARLGDELWALVDPERKLGRRATVGIDPIELTRDVERLESL